ncbi:hypothetical protein EPZ47_14740 [Pseudomonas viciae]|uniref:Uncharacterized protein n=1 Tax=Pseudomonas viciae TaxID=2505979 RepID=A0A4P7PGS2_9PSED|nr:hypothetical protein [Pseudomonas viciae]QBZ89927.1 hypothetical protein EPZ47_14740 [Pseudomonas viciae]
MASRKKLNDLMEAQQRRREELAQLFAARKPLAHAKPALKTHARKTVQTVPVETPAPSIVPRAHEALIAMYRDGSLQPSAPSSTLLALADLYLHAAEHRSRHIVMAWPAAPKTLPLVHALATLVRWHQGDKQGVRGLLFPVKSNAFYGLNHVHFDRTSILRIAHNLLEVSADANASVTRSMGDKDAFYFSLSDSNFPQNLDDPFNPTVGELLPHFLATPDFDRWQSCDGHLLALIRAKLRRKLATALKLNCAVIGDPRTAPDALFALDGRMSETELRRACRDLARFGSPEVVLVQATRAIRMEAKSWKKQLARFCIMLEDVFQGRPPGVIVITDEPHAAFRIKEELWEQNRKRNPSSQWHTPHEFKILGVPTTVGGAGLLAPLAQETLHPAPRELNVFIVDADTAKSANKLVRIANAAPGGKESAKPLIDAASYLSRLAALPCGVRHMSDYLAGIEVSQRTRAAFDWLNHLGNVQEFERTVGVGDQGPALFECLQRSSQLFCNYHEATPFAHKLAELVSNAAKSSKRKVTIVFTSALYLRLAERFLAEYDQYPDGLIYDSFQGRVQLLCAAHLEERLDELQGSTLVCAGLNEDCLRLLLTDDRVPSHTVVLLTQRAGQFLRATLKPIVELMPEFRSFKPRMESILRKLKDLPEDASVLSTSDYVLPTFRVELSSNVSSEGHGDGTESWVIRLDSNVTLFRHEKSEMYVYDPASPRAADVGFRTCQVGSLEVGDKVFIMSAELREMVEQVLREAGVPIQSDKTFETALRSYHEQIQKCLARRFAQGSLSDKVRVIREQMLELDPLLETKLPGAQAMRQWIDLGRSLDTPFEQLRPQAPQREETFKAFATVLGLSPLEAAYQWQRVITAVRNSRRLDGRHVADIYAYMLLQPESVMANSSIKRTTLNQLFDKARESIASVEFVGLSKETLQ